MQYVSVAFVESAPFYEIRDGIVYIRGSLGDGVDCHVMSVRTLRECVAAANEAIAKWEYDRLDVVQPFRLGSA